MSLTAAAIRLLAEKGLSALEIAEVAEAQMPVRSGNAERQARYRANKKAKAGKRNVTRNVTPPNEYISNPPVSPSPDGEAPHDFAEKFVSVWNEGARAGLQEARKLTGQRLTKLKARKRAFGEDDLIEAARNLARSPFHCGKNDRGWAANIGWLLKSDENVAKALELKPATAANDPGSSMAAAILARQRK